MTISIICVQVHPHIDDGSNQKGGETIENTGTS